MAGPPEHFVVFGRKIPSTPSSNPGGGELRGLRKRCRASRLDSGKVHRRYQPIFPLRSQQSATISSCHLIGKHPYLVSVHSHGSNSCRSFEVYEQWLFGKSFLGVCPVLRAYFSRVFSLVRRHAVYEDQRGTNILRWQP